ncbi:MAG TPA: hypothetical protein VFO99_05315 [Pyrinomonadaceae bacterium]|nr:hypothetical protein [Pyrinomonadaceae bacterium]
MNVTSGKKCNHMVQLASRWSLGLLLLFFVYVPAASAQDQLPQPSPTPLMAPPPIKIITKEERAQIDGAGDSKARIRTTMDLAAARLTRAEQLAKQSNYDDALTEVGSYEALIEDSLDFLRGLKRDSNKTRDLCKRVELALRAHGPRLTTMRRETPLEFAVWIKKVEEFARAARTEVLNTFYGHTVVREPEKTNADKRKQQAVPTPTPKSDQP